MGLVLRVSSDSGHRDLTSSSLDFSSQAKSSSSKRLEHGYGLIFAFSFAEVDGLPVCSVEIPAIDLSERPCYYKGTGRMKGSYIRVGDADLPMTDYELYSYEAFRKHLHDDERPIQRASLSTLNQDVLQRYLLERRPIACLSRCLKTVAENLWCLSVIPWSRQNRVVMGHRRTCFPIARFRAPGRKLLPFWELRRLPMLSANMYCRWWKQAN